MKALVHIGGMWEGFWTPTSGEGRWAMSLAHMLALKGHDIVCSGWGRYEHHPPSWGRQPPIPNIKIMTMGEVVAVDKRDYDLFLYVPFEVMKNLITGKMLTCKDLPVKSRVKAHCSFSWNESMAKNTHKVYGCLDDHLIMLPHFLKDDQKTSMGHIIGVPRPMFENFVEPDPVSHKGILWLNKNVFSDEWANDIAMHEAARKTLVAIRDVSNKYDIPCVFASVDNFSSDRAARFGVPDIVNSIRNKTMYKTLLSFDYVNEYMRNSRLNISLPGYFSGCWEAIGNGAYALCFEESDQVKVHLKDSGTYLNQKMSEAEMRDMIEMFYIDDEFYKSEVLKQREVAEVHLYDNSYKYLMEALAPYLQGEVE